MPPIQKQNILVFPCGSEIGLKTHRSLSASNHVTLFDASSVSDHGRFVYERYIEGMPFVDDPGFIDAVNHIVDEHRIDCPRQVAKGVMCDEPLRIPQFQTAC